jgi:hypothetical protein
VIGALVGVVGASFGNKETPGEAAYGSYKKNAKEATVRGWTPDQVGGSVYEAIRSHTGNGSIKKFPDVQEMYSAFGITKDAHKNYKNVQTKMGDFINGVIKTAQGAGGLPTDPAELAKLDGQQVYEKLIKPAMAAKVEETLGRSATSNAWSPGAPGNLMQDIFADWTDYIISGNGQAPQTTQQPATPSNSTPGMVKTPRVTNGRIIK